MALSDSPDQEWYASGLTFTCTQCGNCCTGAPGYVWFNDAEAQAMAAYLGLPEEEFRRRYTRRSGGKSTLTETHTARGKDCVFLRFSTEGKAQCAIYPVRPQQCRTWPFWPENLASQDEWLRAAQRCPGMAAGLDQKGTFYPIEQIRIIRDSNP